MAMNTGELKIKISMSFMDTIKWRILGLHKKNITINTVGIVSEVIAMEPK